MITLTVNGKPRSVEGSTDLVAFLESLSGDEILIEEPDLPTMKPLPAAARN